MCKSSLHFPIKRSVCLMISLLVVLISSCKANATPTVAVGTEEVTPTVAVGTEEARLDFFPLGLFDVLPDDFGYVKAGGFNMVHLYHSAQTLDDAKAYLEAAQAAGLRVRQNMPRQYLYASDEFWIGWVTTLSAYDALAWWYLPEEPTDHAALARLYRIIHQYDPRHRPAVTYFGTLDHLEDWCDVVDIVMIGSYIEYYRAPVHYENSD
jgi:hypothetical protein